MYSKQEQHSRKSNKNFTEYCRKWTDMQFHGVSRDISRKMFSLESAFNFLIFPMILFNCRSEIVSCFLSYSAHDSPQHSLPRFSDDVQNIVTVRGYQLQTFIPVIEYFDMWMKIRRISYQKRWLCAFSIYLISNVLFCPSLLLNTCYFFLHTCNLLM